MILHLPPGTPLVVQIAAGAALVLHVGGAFTALASGGVAMVARKGGWAHRASGNVFFVSMLIMASIGAVVAAIISSRISSVAGLLACYLVSTSWVAVKRRPAEVGRFEAAAALLGLGTAALGFAMGWLGATSPGGQLDGLPYQPAVVFGAIAALGVVCDVRVIRMGGPSGAPRLARHIWRMCSALLLAVLSFTGQPAAIPDFLKGSPLLFAPIVAVAVAMIYWMIRIRIPRRPRARAATVAA
jgi:uncharacterized membrane protein